MPARVCARKPLSRKLVVHLIEGLLGSGLAVVGFNDGVAGVHFLDVAVQSAEMALLTREIFLAATHNRKHHDKAEEAGENSGEGHPEIGDEHHQKTAEKQDHRRDEVTDALVQRLADEVDVVGDTRENITGRSAVVKSHRQAVDLARNIAAQLLGHALGDAGGDPALDGGKKIAQRVERERG